MAYRVSTRFRVDTAGRPVPQGPTIEDAGQLYRARDHAAAERVCDAILARAPQHFDALHLRGVLALDQQRAAEALTYLCRAERERPDDPQLLQNIGTALLELQHHQQAEQAFCRSLAMRPDDVGTMINLGSALCGMQRFNDAEAWFRRALALAPTSPQVLYNLGKALLGSHRPEEAEASFRAALAHAAPDIGTRRLIDIRLSLGDSLIRQCRYASALATYRDVPRELRDEPRLVWNESLTLLVMGDFAEGWRKYEARFLVPDHDPPRDGACVLDLAKVAGRRVLVFSEQGRGDTIQFARYLPLLAARGAQVLVETYADLRPLLETLPGVAQVVTTDDAAPACDLLTPLISLPLAFGTTLDAVPAAVPYVRVPPARAETWAGLLGPATGRRIGVAWRGSPQSAGRSAMAPSLLAPLLHLSGLELHCLQKEPSQQDEIWLAAHPAIRCHYAGLQDFADTAALIGAMDLVISIDTAVAHLAGALGRPVWIMLPFSPDWRWLRDRDDSPWYPTARLFRQEQRGDWAGVVRRVAEALATGS